MMKIISRRLIILVGLVGEDINQVQEKREYIQRLLIWLIDGKRSKELEVINPDD